MSEEGKDSHHSHHSHHHHQEQQQSPSPPPPPVQYGTFQGVGNYPPPQPPVIGFQKPVPPPGASHPPPHHHYHHHQEQQQSPPPPPPPVQYGTFQGVGSYPPPQPPVIGFPKPVPPPGASHPPPHHYYAHGYQAVPTPGYVVAEGTPVRERRLPCCGIGIGWFLFIVGFFLPAVPWYVGAFILLCAQFDHREKPGYIVCMIAAILATIAMVFGLTQNDWD